VQSKRTRVRRDWSQLVREQAASGLSVRSYCERHGINVSLFYHRRRELTRGGGAEEAVGFVRLEAVEAESSSGVTIVSPQGWRVEVAPGFDAGTLWRVWDCLEYSGTCSR